MPYSKSAAIATISISLALRAASNFFAFSGLCAPLTDAPLTGAPEYITETILLATLLSFNPTAFASLFYLSVLSRLANGLGFFVPLLGSTIFYACIFAKWPIWITGLDAYPCAYGAGFWLYSASILLPWALALASAKEKFFPKASTGKAGGQN